MGPTYTGAVPVNVFVCPAALPATIKVRGVTGACSLIVKSEIVGFTSKLKTGFSYIGAVPLKLIVVVDDAGEVGTEGKLIVDKADKTGALKTGLLNVGNVVTELKSTSASAGAGGITILPLNVKLGKLVPG